MFTMFDCDSNGAGIPANPEVVAGYMLSNYATLVARFPKSRHFSFWAGNSLQAADCLDVEHGDATVALAPSWVKWRIEKGAYRPCVYASIATYMGEVEDALKAAGLARSAYRLLVAHWGVEPASVPTGYDGIQWRNTPAFDQSLLAADFFDGPPPRYPTLTAAQKTQLEDVREDLVGIVAQKGALTKAEFDQLQLAYQRVGAIPGVK